MPVDASIYGGIQQVRPANRLAQLAQVMQLEGLQNQNDAAMYTRRKAEREDAEVNALNAAYRDAVGSDGTVDRNKLYQAVAAGGLGSRLPAIQKSFADADTATTNQRKADFDLRKQTTEAVGQAFMGVMQNPTPENAAATIDLLGSRKYFTPQEVAEFKQIVSTNPQAIGPLAERMVRLTASVKDQTASFETRNLGGTTDTLRRDPITGKVVTVNSVNNTQSPDSVASTAIQRDRLEEDKRHHGVTEKNQAETLAQGKLTYDAERGGVVNLRTGEFKSATQGGATMPAKVPESSKKEMASIDAQLSVLDGAIKDVQKAPSAFGMTRGLAQMGGAISESVAGRFDSAEERDARSYVFNVVSKVINERAGAAQSAQELARLRSFLPAETDNAEQITGKLESFKGYLADLRKGYGGAASAPAASPAAAPKGPQPGLVQDGYRFKGGNPADRNSWEKV